MQKQLRIQGRHFELVKQHLFPGDNKEAVAVFLCGRHETEKQSILLSHEVLLIPYDECERHEEYVKWKTERLIPFFEQVEKRNFALVKIHSHPSGYPQFSEVDDASDADFFSAAFSWSGTKGIHASAVMLPDGKIFGRAFHKDKTHVSLDRISVAGESILIWDSNANIRFGDAFAERTIQAFGEGTYAKLKNLKIGVIGCSGTGSPTIEQLMRLGIGTIVLVDPEPVEDKNLNRIVNSKKADVGQKKVHVLKQAIRKTNLGTKVVVHPVNLFDSKNALLDLITCDVLIGCMDSVEGRHLTTQVANFYVIPYFDQGIRLIADGRGGVKTVVGSVHYTQPGKSTLLSRGVFSLSRLAAEGLLRTAPEAYKEQLKQKYIEGVDVDRPAVISLNMLISSIAVMELLNRIHPFKDEPGNSYAKIMVDYCGSCIENRSEDSFNIDASAAKWAGRGDCKPFLRMPEFVS